MTITQVLQTCKQLQDAIETSKNALKDEYNPRLRAYLEGTIKGLEFALVLLETYLG